MRPLFFAILTMAMAFIIAPAHAANDAISKTVEAVNLEKTKLSGQQVTLRGKVIKVNNGIMKRNFVHIQDGTGASDNTNRVIITSTQTANVGDEIVATGIVTLDTDFGMGYAYPLLIEKSTITKVK